jgi:hypothetical protein
LRSPPEVQVSDFGDEWLPLFDASTLGRYLLKNNNKKHDEIGMKSNKRGVEGDGCKRHKEKDMVAEEDAKRVTHCEESRSRMENASKSRH